MKPPQWYAETVAMLGQRVLDGEATRADTLTALIASIRKHPEYVADLVAADAKRELTRWLADNQPEDDAPFQSDLFPELPRRMRVTPSKYVEVAAMDAHHLDMARNILWARTQNAIDGAKDAAEHERQVFTAFYEKVRPLMAGDLTVRDALDQLDGDAAGGEA